jgi:hypothetical protein
MVKVAREYTVQELMSLPLPDKLGISVFFLGYEVDLVETILTFKFANMQARYRVIGISIDGRQLIGELIQQSEKRLAPYIPVDPETMPKLS